jgi:hypothetical protein
MFEYKGIPSFATAAVLSAALASAACGRAQETPVAEERTQTAQAANQPTTVSGCLKQGDAPDTLVLTTSRTTGSPDTATYVLVGEQAAGLRDHVGRQVEVSGTVKAQQEVTTRADALPAEKATGTSGTPTVQTRTELEFKRLEVSGARLLGVRCEM